MKFVNVWRKPIGREMHALHLRVVEVVDDTVSYDEQHSVVLLLLAVQVSNEKTGQQAAHMTCMNRT